MNVRILISAMLCFLLIGYGVKLQAEPTESLPVEAGVIPVSYTHLTLPTILLV